MATKKQEPQDNPSRTLKGLFSSMEAERSPYLMRARRNAELSIPQIFPPQSASGVTNFPVPYQSDGARNVNSLASKLTTATLPPTQPFFRLDIDEMTMRRMLANAMQAGPDQQSQLTAYSQQVSTWQTALGKIERTINMRINASTLRAKAQEMNKQLVIGGNSLIYVESPKKTRVYRLDHYVQRLDAMGTLLQLVVVEKVGINTLEPEVQAACDVKTEQDEANFDDGYGVTQYGPNDQVEVYTGVQLISKGRYRVHQEINGKLVPGSIGSYPADKLPWIPLRFFAVDGESYGRSFFDEYFGDFQSLEGLSKAIVQGAAAAARVLYMVKPGSQTAKRKLTSARNGDVIDGHAEDVTVLQLNKFADFQVASTTRKEIKEDLGRSFLSNSSVQRSGERVTAEEIRTMVQELEEELGGHYSILAQQFQVPLVNILMAQMQADGSIPALPHDMVNISITTGLAAMGRGQDADAMVSFLQEISQLDPQAQASVDWGVFISRLAVAKGIDADGLIKSPDQVALEQQAAQRQALMQQTAPGVIQEMAKQGMAHGVQSHLNATAPQQQTQGQPPQ